MSNRQKFLTVLSMMIQPEAPSPRAAWRETEKSFDKNLKLLSEFSEAEAKEMLTYLAMGLNTLRSQYSNELMHDIMLDDIRTCIHDRACPKCKGKPEPECYPEDTSGNAADDAGAEGPTIRSFGSIEDLMQAVAGDKESSN